MPSLSLFKKKKKEKIKTDVGSTSSSKPGEKSTPATPITAAAEKNFGTDYTVSRTTTNNSLGLSKVPTADSVVLGSSPTSPVVSKQTTTASSLNQTTADTQAAQAAQNIAPGQDIPDGVPETIPEHDQMQTDTYPQKQPPQQSAPGLHHLQTQAHNYPHAPPTPQASQDFKAGPPHHVQQNNLPTPVTSQAGGTQSNGQADTSATPASNPVRATKGKYSLGDFAIQRTLGTGSFGRVHLVQSKHNLRFYAVKVLKKGQVVKMKQVEHTNDERRMLQRVKHPFLITLWGTFQDSKNLYMVMDFIEGGELFSLLRKSQRFPNPVAKFYAAEVALALDYLHGHSIIYRDLKPENLLLDRHGHLKITDFGFAKEVPDITWTLCGTPDYLAPEVVASKGYNKSVDWWSLGILIFEMLCGYTPFWDGGSPMKIYENILKGRVKYPPYIHPDAQNLLQQLITSDLTKRLGNLLHGSRDVMQHPWFAEVNWERLAKRDIEAPYVPPVRGGVGDSSLFDRYPEETEAYGATGDDPYGNLFPDF